MRSRALGVRYPGIASDPTSFGSATGINRTRSCSATPGRLHPSVRPFANYPGGHNEGFPDTFKQLFRVIYDTIDTGDRSAPRPFPTFQDGHREVVLCEAIMESHRQSRWVEIDSDPLDP